MSARLRSAPILYVPQDYSSFGDQTVGSYLKERASLLQLERRLRRLERELAEGLPVFDAYVEATDRYMALGGYELPGRIDRALAALQLPSTLLTAPSRSCLGGSKSGSGSPVSRDASKAKDTRPPRENDKHAPHFFAQRASRQAGKTMKSLEQRLARMGAPEQPRAGWQLRLDLSRAARSGDLVVELHNVRKTYGNFTLGPLSLYWQDRLVLQGHNGAGKSILVSLLTEAMVSDAGTVRRGNGVHVGVLRQSGSDLANGSTGLSVFQRHVPTSQAEARALLAKFDLGAGHVHRPVDSYRYH
jgi:ATPase subunit of ABC transporter with duplicated ATPase domains